MAVSEVERGLPAVCRFCGYWERVSSLVRGLEGRMEDYLSKLRWAQAELENLLKRMEREKEEASQVALGRLVLKLLEVLDNFERALKNREGRAFAEGVEMIYRQLVKVLEEEGLEPIQAVGTKFDPFLHEAVDQVEVPGVEGGRVVEELQRGYKFRSKLLRASKVRVSRSS